MDWVHKRVPVPRWRFHMFCPDVPIEQQHTYTCAVYQLNEAEFLIGYSDKQATSHYVQTSCLLQSILISSPKAALYPVEVNYT